VLRKLLAPSVLLYLACSLTVAWQAYMATR
jgi:hypothetical protein